MVAPRNVIIFGATGAIGSVATLKAHQEGIKVTLAMQDPSKPIATLDDVPAQKVQADLTKPETVRTAVCQSGATTAFIYAIHQMPDSMRSTLEALKESGIEAVVLLSSFTVNGDLCAIPPADIVPYFHAKVEIALGDAFGDRRTAVRPAYFASNALQYKNGIVQGQVRLLNPDIEFDWISPEDIGRVVGVILAHVTQECFVPLVGPNRLSLIDILSVIGRALSKEIKITIIGKEEAVEDMQPKGLPKVAAKWFVESVTGKRSFIWDVPDHQVGVDNVQKYTHNAPVRFEQWLKENKERFTA